MSTPPFEVTGNKESRVSGTAKATPEKLLPEKPFKIEKFEKIEHKEKPEKIEHKEKPEKIEHKEKPEKWEHKEKPEKFEHKEKPEKFEHKEKLEKFEKIEHKEKIEKLERIEKPDVLEKGGKDLEPEGPPGNPGDPWEQRIAALEQTVGQLQHFITTNLRPDLSKGALKQEPGEEKSRKG